MTCLVVTRVQPQADAWTRFFHAHGWPLAQALPLLEISPNTHPAAQPALEHALDALCASANLVPLQDSSSLPNTQPYHALMFVSLAAVDHFFTQLRQRGHSVADLNPALRYWTVGPGTARAIAAQGIAPDRIDSPAADATHFDSEALWQCIATQMRLPRRVLIVRGHEEDASDDAPTAVPTHSNALEINSPQSERAVRGSGRQWLTRTLQHHGAHVELLAVYVRRAPVLDAALHQRLVALRHTSPVIWLFSSAQCVQHLAQYSAQLWPAQPVAACWAHHHAIATHERIAQHCRTALGMPTSICRPVQDEVLAHLQAMARA